MSICWNGFSLTNKKAFVTSGKAFHASQTLFLPLPLKEEVASHPEKAWNTGNECAFCTNFIVDSVDTVEGEVLTHAQCYPQIEIRADLTNFVKFS